MTLQDKITQFINKSQSKIAELALVTASDLHESYGSSENIKLANELVDVITCLQDELLDWTNYEIEFVIDYYTYVAELVDIPIVSFVDMYTYISDGEVSENSNSWGDPFNALNTKVNSNHAYLLGEIDRLDGRIDNLDFSNLIPQEVLDDIAANTAAQHTHANKPVLDSVTQGHLDAIANNTAHRNNSSIHVTSIQKTTWDNKVSTQQLADGLATKANLSHQHPFSDIPGLAAAFASLEPEKGDPGEPGASPIIQVGTVEEGEVLSITVDNANPLSPIFNFVIPVAEDGDDFHIDVYGNASERLRSTYNDSPEGYSFLGMDNGVLYFRKPFDSNGDPILATTTSGWTGVQFLGEKGWSPVLGTRIISDTKTVLVLKGWIGGTGNLPQIDLTYPVYVSDSGYTYDINLATNIKGSPGPVGAAGKIMFPDMSGTFAERSNYDNAQPDFIYLDEIAGVIYRKLSTTIGDWSNGYQWQGDKGEPGLPGEALPISVVEKAEFIPQEIVPAHKAGIVYFDAMEDALTYYNSVSGISNQLGREIWVRVKNLNNYVIPNGKVVYINSAIDDFPTVDFADCCEYTSSRVIGVATMNIGQGGSIGYVTFLGKVRDINTIDWVSGTTIYLKENFPGDISHIPPTGGSYKVRIGVVSRQSETQGSIEVNVFSNEYTVETVGERGFPDKSLVNLTWDDVTRTLSIAPTSTKYRFYQNGEKYTKTALDTLQIPDVEGSYFFYFASGVLSYLFNGTKQQIESLVENYPLVAYIYWDADTKRATFEGNELHWSKGYGVRNHVKDHSTIGAIYGSGFNQLGGAITGNGSLAADAQFGSEVGTIFDEDLGHTIPGFASIDGVAKVYFTNALGYARFGKLANFSVLTAGTGRLAFNPTGSALSECPDNSYVWYHLFSSGALIASEGLCTFVGKSSYASTTAAYEGLSADLVAIQQTSLPSPEFTPIASRLFQTRNTYTNAVKARLVAADAAGSLFVDWRFSKLIGSRGASSTASPVIPVFNDTDFRIFKAADATALAKVSAANISPNTTREFLVPNKNGTFALTSDLNLYEEVVTVPSTAAYTSGTVILDITNMIKYQLYDDGIQKIWVEL